MKFEELKINLKQKINNAYLLKGVDEYLLSSAYNLIYKYSNLQMPDLNLIKFSEGVIDCNDVIRALDTMPVFCDKKIVYLDLRMSRKSELKNSKLLDEYLTNPNTMSILIVNVGDNEELDVFDNKKFVIVDCNRLDYKYISLKVKSIATSYKKQINDDAIKLLSEYCLNDLAKIVCEMDKLVAYVGSRNDINIFDIKEIVNKSLEYQIFELTDSLAKKKSKRVFEILEDMKSKKDEYKILPSLIFAHFRKLFMVALNTNLSNMELSKLLGIKEYAVKMTINQVNLFTKAQLKKINELCINLDYDLKQSNISIDNYVNLIVMQILNI